MKSVIFLNETVKFMEADTIQNGRVRKPEVGITNNRCNIMKNTLLVVAFFLLISATSFAQTGGGWIHNPAVNFNTVEFVQAECAGSETSFAVVVANVISNWKVEMILNEEEPEVEAPMPPMPPMPPATRRCEMVVCVISEWK